MKKNKLANKDKEFVWHPFTEMSGWLSSDPLIIESGHGCYLVDTDGNEYIDGVSSLWTNVHGHRVAAIDEAVKAQIDQISHTTLLGLGNVPSIEFAEKLSSYLPGDLKRIFYSDSGATSVEVALKLAFSHWHFLQRNEKQKFIRFEGAYHGDTIGSVSVGGIDSFHKLFQPLLFDSPVAPYPFCYRCPFKLDEHSCGKACFEQIKDIISKHAPTCAGIVIEPIIQGASGMRKAPAGFLSFLQSMCKKHDLLLIVDEVATGFGRTGKMFACEHEQVIPDILSMAKGISGGYLPLAATAVSERLFQSFLGNEDEIRTFFHGHTYTGNPLACAAAIASLDLFESNSIIDELGKKIELYENRLQRLLKIPFAGDVRNAGLMAGVELVLDRDEKISFDPLLRIGAKVCLALRDFGLILRPLGDVIVINPPLSIEIRQIDIIFDILEKNLEGIIRDTI